MDQPPSKLAFIDCETTGLPATRHFSAEDVSGWPRLVQLAWAIFDNRGRPLENRCHIIRPKGFRIPRDATLIHGISHAQALRSGDDLERVLTDLLQAIAQPGTMLVAHNLAFDLGVIGGELVRTGLPVSLFDLPGICTMKETTDLCRLPRPWGGGFKWPTLEELHAHLFGGSYDRPHDAGRDVEACAKCFLELVKRGWVSL
ncbi:MAG: 3'-5' exonuclease [Candidatus Aminicenantes bacterium]|nr:3'-5' exonuclease [Candidatus Aminicenantes bacterium]